MTGHGDGAVSEWDKKLGIELGTVGVHGAMLHKDGYVSNDKAGDDDNGLVVTVGGRNSAVRGCCLASGRHAAFLTSKQFSQRTR